MDKNFSADLDNLDNLDLAVHLALQDWRVFPCWPIQGPQDKNTVKSPMTPHGYKDATDNLDKIEAWWKQTPDALVGISCADSGLLVVDLDRHDGQPDGVAAYTKMAAEAGVPLTIVGPAQTTPGNGQHLIFKAPRLPDGWDVPGKLAPGIDLKYNGYICTGKLPDGHSYQWQPEHYPDTRLTYPPRWIARFVISHNTARAEIAQPRSARTAQPGTLSPADDFAARTDWGDTLLLGGIGWRRSGRVGDKEYWTRPGKRSGVSATVNYSGKDNLYIFSTNASPFEPEKSYSKFGAYALLHHGGNYKAAVRALKAAGYGYTAQPITGTVFDKQANHNQR